MLSPNLIILNGFLLQYTIEYFHIQLVTHKNEKFNLIKVNDKDNDISHRSIQ